MTITHAPATHPLADGTIAVCCQDAWWCDDCGQFGHMAFDQCPTDAPLCWPCLRTRDYDKANELATARMQEINHHDFYGTDAS